ncbi:hypothetical protein MUDAN_DOGOELCO_00987 [Lactiplantibacillus mudanjiangensis]|uniref:hypothetical protein n=1 Tax=Lactiplantibacillus mudanjiangensis TaxID=1296538 RepID=UPI0010141B2C|nr:hypothetical protein [Lactiplantibacillus mudanjiangensis]VDG31697.1 hypothetical protein MUDAN_DOGOELCO_00987 [Lactiplantibacillus mudanjiangensis]
MKTKLTKQLESTLYQYCLEQGAYVVEEVSMPAKKGIVDTLSYQLGPDNQVEWRCYELKVTKADFHSKAQLSFIGHYNYFVLPQALYEEVADEIPTQIGVLIYRPFDQQAVDLAPQPLRAPGFLTVAKKAQHQDLQVDETALTGHFVASLFREVDKAKRVKKGLQLYSDDQLFKALKKRAKVGYDIYQPDHNLYDRFVDDIQNEAITALQIELDARNAEYQALQLKYRALVHPDLEDQL